MTYTDILNILLTPSVTFVIGILTVIISRNTNVSSIAMERLKFVYHPLFLSIEPFLYQKVTFEDVTPFLDKYNEIERNHSLLISPKLRHSIRVLSENNDRFSIDKYGNNDWFYVCTLISSEYDRLCRQSHIPVRSVSYRISNKQYSSKLLMFLGQLWINAPAIVVFFIFISLTLGSISPIALLIAYFLFLAALLIKAIDYL